MKSTKSLHKTHRQAQDQIELLHKTLWKLAMNSNDLPLKHRRKIHRATTQIGKLRADFIGLKLD